MIDISTWIPGERLGVVVLGRHVREYTSVLGLALRPPPPDDIPEMETVEYQRADGALFLLVDPDGTVHAVETRRSLRYRGVELLNLELPALERALGCRGVLERAEGPCPYAVFSALHATFWLEEGIVESATLSWSE